jgi:hypothetical protein
VQLRMDTPKIVSTISILVCSMQTPSCCVSQTRCGWVYQPRNPVGNAYKGTGAPILISGEKKCRQATKRASDCGYVGSEWR